MITKIKLYTTLGCMACKIMHKIIKQVNMENIEFEEIAIPITPEGSKMAKSLNINDYPTLMLYKDNNEIITLTGTYPKDYIQKLIDNN